IFSPPQLYGNDEIREGEDFRERHENAGDENDQREMPRPRMPKIHDPAHDRVRLRAEQRARVHDRQDISRDVQDIGCDQKGPGARDTVRLAQMERSTTASTAHVVNSGKELGQAATPMTGAQSHLTRRHSRLAHLHSSAKRHNSCVLNVHTAAVSKRMSPPNDQRARPGTTCARCASLTKETNTPRINTCVMLHGRMACNVRRIVAKPPGNQPSLNGRRTYVIKDSSKAGMRMVVTKTNIATPTMSLSHMVWTAPYRLVWFRVPCTSNPTIGYAFATMKRITAPSV